MSGVAQILVLGGSTEGYALADALASRREFRVVSSLAGRTTSPRLPPGETRIGGFGGIDGLATYLVAHGVSAVVDATHPFARTMGWNVAAACARTGVPLLRLERPPWYPTAGDEWIEVDTWSAAVDFVAARARRVFLAIGRQDLAAFARLDSLWFLIRSVDTPAAAPAFRRAEILLARGPFTQDEERTLLAARCIDTIVCKNSGGTATDAKLAAARELGIRVVMMRRPPRPALTSVASVADALAWLQTAAASAGLP